MDTHASMPLIFLDVFIKISPVYDCHVQKLNYLCARNIRGINFYDTEIQRRQMEPQN